MPRLEEPEEPAAPDEPLGAPLVVLDWQALAMPPSPALTESQWLPAVQGGDSMFRDGFASITLLRQVVKHSPTGAMAPLSTPAVQALLNCSSSLRSALGKNALFALEESAVKQLVSHDAAVRMCHADCANNNPRIEPT